MKNLEISYCAKKMKKMRNVLKHDGKIMTNAKVAFKNTAHMAMVVQIIVTGVDVNLDVYV
jgi:hypothetical protein